MFHSKRLAIIFALIAASALCVSCFGGKNTAPEKEQEIITEGGEDYVKVPNPLYAVWRGQPEYVYVPKSQYRPLLGERFTGEGERVRTLFLEKKIAELERKLKEGNMGGGGGGIAIPADRVMKKKVVLLPLEDHTESLTKPKQRLFSDALSSSLEKTKRAEMENPVVLKPYQDQKWWKEGIIDEDLLGQAGAALGIQAFLKLKIDRMEIIKQLTGNTETYKATISLTAVLYDGLSGRKIYTDTVTVLPEEIPSQKSAAAAEDTLLEVAAKKVAFSILSPLDKLEWFTHIVRVDKEKVFIQGGRSNGLYVGDLLNVYDKPGKEIFNQLTGEFLGREPGKFKGRLQIVEFFGVNAAITKPVLGESFKVGDFVKLAR